MWDMYRFRSGDDLASFTNAQRIMTAGGPTLNSQYYFVPGQIELGLSDGGPTDGNTANNADGNQSSHWRERSKNGFVYIGIMDPTIPPGTRRDITDNDTNALSTFGYNSNTPDPPPNDNFARAVTVSGCEGSVNGTNIGATHETDEPNHEPNGNGGTRSVWYTWQAPSSGKATITTAGSDFDTVLAVYIGSSVGSLTPIKKNDDVELGVITTSMVEFDAVAGTTLSDRR